MVPTNIVLTLVIGMLNDLWRYRINDSTWTWVSGSNTINHPGVYGEKGIPNSDNYPGSRSGALALYDSCTQTFILFGGYGFDEGHFGVYFAINSILFNVLICVFQDI